MPQISNLESEIDRQYEQFKNQIRSSYMSPEYSFLEYLFGSESFADFSVRMETVTRISEHDPVGYRSVGSTDYRSTYFTRVPCRR